eukprot:g2543.t1
MQTPQGSSGGAAQSRGSSALRNYGSIDGDASSPRLMTESPEGDLPTLDNNSWNEIGAESPQTEIVLEGVIVDEHDESEEEDNNKGGYIRRQEKGRPKKFKDSQLGRALLPHFNEQDEKRDEQPTYRIAAIVTCPLFMGYACLFALQHKVKAAYGIPDDGSALSNRFSAAVSFLYINNLIFRFGHNVVFGMFTPWLRTIIAIGAMSASMLLLLVEVYWKSAAGEKPSLAWVYVAYSLGGVAIGSFEANLLSCITPLGDQTKLYATLGIPAGVSIITIGAFAAMAGGLACEWVYIITLCLCGVAFFVFAFCIPYKHVQNNSDTLSSFLKNLRSWRLWLPLIKWHCLCLAVDMLMVSTFSPGLMLYVFDGTTVPLFGSVSVPHDLFFSIYNLFTFAGETISRKWAYIDRERRSPFLFLIFSGLGALLNILGGSLGLGVLCPVAGLMVFLANGSIYNRTCKEIDHNVGKQFNLLALSTWLLIGDVGSVTGSNLIPFLRTAISK